MSARAMPLPAEVLMCPPDYFDVIDVKNPFMEGQIGKVNLKLARSQWLALKECFLKIGLRVSELEPVAHREDMVFSANQTFPGLDSVGNKICVLSQMKHPSRQEEIPAFEKWFKRSDYTTKNLPSSSYVFEGGGDALWHPGRRLIWGGFGQRTQKEIYPFLSETFDAPVLLLEMKTERFYHLDTCLCLIDEKTALVYPPSFTEKSFELISHSFPNLIIVNQVEAMEQMACNGASFFGKKVVIQKGSEEVCKALRSKGFEVFEVDTSEYMKSGGSVFCMKMSVF